MTMRIASLEARDAHYRMIEALEDGVKRPKIHIGTTKLNSRFVSDKHDQPKGLRRAGFKVYLQHTPQKSS